MKTIIISGTPCTGKTKLAKALAKKLKAKYIDVNSLIKKHKLHEGYDKITKSYSVDTKKLNKFLVDLIKDSKQDLIIDSHLSHYLPRKYVDLCIITKCSLPVLKKRLKKRKYSEKKIRENLDAEIFDICLTEAQNKNHKIKVIDTTQGIRKVLKLSIL